MKKVAPLLILGVVCGCVQHPGKPLQAVSAKTDLLNLPVIVVNGEICGTYTKCEFQKGKYRRLGWRLPEHQFTLRKDGSFTWSREKVLYEPGSAELWAMRSLDYVAWGRWSRGGTLLLLDGFEKVVQEESKPAKSISFTLRFQIREKELVPNGTSPKMVYQKISSEPSNTH